MRVHSLVPAPLPSRALTTPCLLCFSSLYAHSSVPGEAAKRREVLFRMRKELELLIARLSGAQTGLDRCVRVAIHVPCINWHFTAY